MSKNLNNIKKTGFKTPEGYFDNFENQILDKIKKDESLKSIVNPGFNVPDGYFINLEEAVFNKLHTTDNTKVVSLFSRRNLIYLSGVAAADLSVVLTLI